MSEQVPRSVEIDVARWGYVCPECGAHVETVQQIHPHSAVVKVRPCEHEASLGLLDATCVTPPEATREGER